MRKLEKKQIYM